MTQYTDEDLEGGVYVSMVPFMSDSFRKFYDFATNLFDNVGIDLYPVEELHCTLIYSRGASPTAKDCYEICNPREMYVAAFKEMEMYPGHDDDGYLVIVFNSKDMTMRHRQWLGIGAEHSFPDYKCHITLASKFDIESKNAKMAFTALKNYFNSNPLTVHMYGEKFEPIKK